MTTKKPVFVAWLETRSFSFVAVGRTEPEAMAAMRAAWDKHQVETGADDWDTFADSVGVEKLCAGEAARDGSIYSSLYE